MLYVRRSLTVALALALLGQLGANFSTSAKIKEVKVRGYVTAMKSANEFEIEEYKISRDAKVRLELEKPSGASANPEDLKVGSLLEVKGTYNDETGNLVASKVKLLSRKAELLDSTTILEQRPTLEPAEGNTWRGTIVADGRRVKIEPTTAISYKLNKSETKESKEAAKKKKADGKAADVDPDESDLPAALQAEGAVPLNSLNSLDPGIFMSYRGTEQADGSVNATQVVFVKNEQEDSEYELWKDLTPKTKPATATAPAELKIGDSKYKVSANAELQAYVERVGQSLIPAYQENMREGDPNKIPFHFTVVMQKGFNAAGYPNGQVVINDEVFTVLENEAQLAAVLAHEIAHATQEHRYRQQEYRKGSRRALQTLSVIAAIAGDMSTSDGLDDLAFAIQAGYGRSMENQADRLGLQYMFDAGYDPREAPKVWRLIDRRYGDGGSEYYWSSSQGNLERRSFQVLAIRNNYAGRDFDAMKKNEAEYKRAAELAIAANPKIKRS
jgi:hypothetical protein